MRYFIVTILFVALTTAYSEENNNPYYSQTTQGIFENFVGQWNVIYANETESGLPATGRGSSKSFLTMGKTVLKFENSLDYRLGTIISYYIIGYDKFKKNYYFLSYDNASFTPILLTGSYDKESHSFEFKNYKDKSIRDGQSDLIIKFERKDKLVMTYYNVKDGQRKKILDMAFLKK